MDLRIALAENTIEVYEGGNWTDVNIKDTLADVDYIEASTIVDGYANTIASLVHHITFYNQVVKSRLYGIYDTIPAANGFDVKDVKGPEEWYGLQKDSLRSAQDLAVAIQSFPLDKLFTPTKNKDVTFYKMLQGLTEHTHYHLGEIVVLKKIIKQHIEA